MTATWPLVTDPDEEAPVQLVASQLPDAWLAPSANFSVQQQLMRVRLPAWLRTPIRRPGVCRDLMSHPQKVGSRGAPSATSCGLTVAVLQWGLSVYSNNEEALGA